ncbi:Lrp/AsnC family transcriptional regulator [Kitasatospora sp. NPDC091207]|uniref:Lrp/AsnC family transcriptional regulator n=1 Tax=Kitasatospora sp. NPDC091207 TaxID=3364083 RepID=UPI0038160248
MDALDSEILGELRADARISYRDLGARVGLSANATADRVRRLLRTGVIRGFTALVDPAADSTRPGLTVFVDVRLRPETDSDTFETTALRLPGVTETAHVTGEYDYLLRARVADAAGLDQLLRRLKHEAGVAHSNTRLALRIATR